jgi:hypothetical protein
VDCLTKRAERHAVFGSIHHSNLERLGGLLTASKASLIFLLALARHESFPNGLVNKAGNLARQRRRGS